MSLLRWIGVSQQPSAQNRGNAQSQSLDKTLEAVAVSSADAKRFGLENVRFSYNLSTLMSRIWSQELLETHSRHETYGVLIALANGELDPGVSLGDAVCAADISLRVHFIPFNRAELSKHTNGLHFYGPANVR